MKTAIDRKNALAKRRRTRVRSKLFGTAQRPRLTVFRSNRFTYTQVIDDSQGKTLAASNELMLKKRTKKAFSGTKIERAKQLAELLAEQLSKQNITKLCFDRGSYRYHGRLRMIAETLREKGIEV